MRPAPRLLVLILAVVTSMLAGCRQPASPSLPPPAGAPVSEAPPPAGLVPLVEEEVRLFRCLESRTLRAAAELAANQAMPLQTAEESACVVTGVETILAIPIPSGPLNAPWRAELEDYRACRGILAFVATSPADLLQVSQHEDRLQQAAWLREHLEACRTFLLPLQRRLGLPA